MKKLIIILITGLSFTVGSAQNRNNSYNKNTNYQVANKSDNSYNGNDHNHGR